MRECFVRTFTELSFCTAKLLYDAPKEKGKFTVDWFDLAIGGINIVTNFYKLAKKELIITNQPG